MLRKLGEVLHATRNGYIVVKPDDPERLPPLGVPVYDKDLKVKYGTVLDIIGPVKNPLVVVKPENKEVLQKVKSGEELYYVPPKPPKKRKKKGRQRRKRAPGGTGKASKQRRGGARESKSG